MKFSVKDFFSKCEQIHKKLRICSHLLRKSLTRNFVFFISVFQYFSSDSLMRNFPNWSDTI